MRASQFMDAADWQLTEPLDAVVFDCDATLSQIEGIDVLADQNHVAEEVRRLTDMAMGVTGINPDIYRQRLDLVNPSRQQIEQLGNIYYEHMTPDVDRVIAALRHLGKKIYVISAGIQAAVVAFAEKLNIPAEHVFAVDVFFTPEGGYHDFDHDSPMTQQQGKRHTIRQLKTKHARVAHVGDGMNDVAVANEVERFIGYGGVAFRQGVADISDFYIITPSLLAALPLCVTSQEFSELAKEQQTDYQLGATQIIKNSVAAKKL